MRKRTRQRVSRLVVAAVVAASLASGAVALASTGTLTPKGCWGDVASNPAGCANTTNGIAGGLAIDPVVSPDGKFLYVAAQTDFKDAIVIFARDTSTGALTPAGCVGAVGANPGCAQKAKGLKGLTSLAISPDGKSVYAGANALVHFERDTTTGKLTRIGCTGGVTFNPAGCIHTATGFDNPTGIVVSSDGTSLYTTSFYNNAVLMFKRNTTNGQVTSTGCAADAASNPAGCGIVATALKIPEDLTLTSDGRSLYVAAAGDAAVSHFQRTSAGGLNYIGCIADDSSNPAGCARTAAGLQTPIKLVASADGKSLYVASNSTDGAIAEFSRNTTNGRLGILGCIGFDANGGSCSFGDPGDLAGIRGLAITADGKSLYVGTDDDQDIANFNRDTGTGALTHIGCVGDVVSNPAGCSQTAKALRNSYSLAVSPDGRSLYDGSGYGLVRFKRSL